MFPEAALRSFGEQMRSSVIEVLDLLSYVQPSKQRSSLRLPLPLSTWPFPTYFFPQVPCVASNSMSSPKAFQKRFQGRLHGTFTNL